MKLSESQIQQAVQLYRSGSSLSEIADKFDVTDGAINYHLDKRDVEKRSVSEALKGREITWGDKIGKAQRGKTISEEARKKMSEAKQDFTPWNKGLTKAENPDKINYGMQGEDHWNWKGGKSEKLTRLRQSSKYKEWRDAVYERDNYTCQDCGQKGGKLNAHHIESFAENPKKRFDVDNGVTLCESCHAERH